MRSAAGFLLLLAGLAWVPAAQADEPRTADEVTAPGRSLGRALDVVLRGGSAQSEKRTLVFLIDPTPSLKAAGFSEAFRSALARQRDALVATRVGVAVAGSKEAVALARAGAGEAAAERVEEALRAPLDVFQNVYADLRRIAGWMGGRSGTREVVLVTLENGDVEDDIQGTAAALRRAKVRLLAITREAFLADSFWVSSNRQVPRGSTLGTGDGPFLELPWGWLFQQTIANEATPSGYAHFGLNRLAEETDGRIFLYSAPGQHRCAVYGSCWCCSEDHLPVDESFQSHRMRALAPLVLPRGKALGKVARDPWYRAVLRAWNAATKEKLLRSRPSVKAAGGKLKLERRQQGDWLPLLGTSLGFKRLAGKADKAAEACSRILTTLESDLAAIDADAGSGRYRAMAELTRVMLYVTRANLVAYAGWCREAAPALAGKQERSFEPPEADPVFDEVRITGISYTAMCLCHGVGPFRKMHLPGGAPLDEELERLEGIVKAFMRRYAHTPYLLALRHQGLARFTFTYQGKTQPPPPRPQPGSTAESPTTTRPPRGGAPSGGSGSGAPTTGGG